MEMEMEMEKSKVEMGRGMKCIKIIDVKMGRGIRKSKFRKGIEKCRSGNVNWNWKNGSKNETGSEN